MRKAWRVNRLLSWTALQSDGKPIFTSEQIRQMVAVDGSIGFSPIFLTREQAEAWVGGRADVCEIELEDMVVPKEAEKERGGGE